MNQTSDPKIKELLQDLKGKTIFGLKRTLKLLKKGEVQKIYLASDAPPLPKFNLKEKVEIIKLNQNKEELKEICRKKFNISVISVLKEQKE
ncbi:MAG: ribosomal L7Ae/L30e/S12e/Gadd45 family protein [Candidatus Pacearchaeota archaeon]